MLSTYCISSISWLFYYLCYACIIDCFCPYTILLLYTRFIFPFGSHWPWPNLHGRIDSHIPTSPLYRKMAFAFTNLINNSFFGFFCGPPVHNRVEERDPILQTAEIVCSREHVSIPMLLNLLTWAMEHKLRHRIWHWQNNGASIKLN